MHIELDPDVVKEMALNYGGLYQMLPGRPWFNHSPFDGAFFDPRYLGQASGCSRRACSGISGRPRTSPR